MVLNFVRKKILKIEDPQTHVLLNVDYDNANNNRNENTALLVGEKHEIPVDLPQVEHDPIPANLVNDVVPLQPSNPEKPQASKMIDQNLNVETEPFIPRTDWLSFYRDNPPPTPSPRICSERDSFRMVVPPPPPPTPISPVSALPLGHTQKYMPNTDRRFHSAIGKLSSVHINSPIEHQLRRYQGPTSMSSFSNKAMSFTPLSKRTAKEFPTPSAPELSISNESARSRHLGANSSAFPPSRMGQKENRELVDKQTQVSDGEFDEYFPRNSERSGSESDDEEDYGGWTKWERVKKKMEYYTVSTKLRKLQLERMISGQWNSDKEDHHQQQKAKDCRRPLTNADTRKTGGDSSTNFSNNDNAARPGTSFSRHWDAAPRGRSDAGRGAGRSSATLRGSGKPDFSDGEWHTGW